MPKASIIITTHNRPHLLPRAICSARKSAAGVEIVVVDDSSSDETAQVCQSFSDIHYVRLEHNQGVAGARNIGLLASHGEYISFLDDDDSRMENTLDQQIEILERESTVGLIYGQAILEEANEPSSRRAYPSECPHGDIFWKILSRNFIPCGSAVFRRSCISRVGMLDKRIAGIDDWDLWIRIAEIYPVFVVETPLVTWRRSTPASGQGTSHAAELVSLAVRQLRQCWINLPRAAHASQEMKRETWHRFSENMAEHLICESGRALAGGEINQATKNLFAIRRLDPSATAHVVGKRVLGVPGNNVRGWRKPIPGRMERRAR